MKSVQTIPNYSLEEISVNLKYNNNYYKTPVILFKLLMFFLLKQNNTFSLSGLGFSLTFNHRDNILYSSSGYFLKLSCTFYRLSCGSDYSFDKYMIDYRNFWTIYDSHLLAFHVYSNLTLGGSPFYKSPQVGARSRKIV